jgi:hypothetical protein
MRKSLLCIGVFCAICGQAFAGPRSSANYSITTDTVDSTGFNVLSASYALYGSAMGEFGAEGSALETSAAYTIKPGYVGPLADFLVLTSAASRKTHSGVGTFDIRLSLAGPIGIECRAAGAGGAHQLIVTFASNVTFSSASVSGGGSGTASATGNQITVNLTGVGNPARLLVSLNGVSNGFDSSDELIPAGILLGDTTGNGSVNASDVSQTKVQSGQAVSAANFREDVTLNGSINSSDISQVKSRSGTALP